MAAIQQLAATDVKEAIRAFIVENFLFGNLEKRFEDTDSFLEKGIIDSTGVLELIEFIEERYEVKAEDNELIPENFDSLNNIASYVVRKKEAQ